MHASYLLSLALVALAPLLPEDAHPPHLLAEARLPVTLVADLRESPPGSDFDIAAASSKVVEGAALQLRARGFAVRVGRGGGFLVMPAADGPSDAVNPTPATAVTLSFGFRSCSNPWASGSETRFGGEGDDGWRLAARVQRHLVDGLRDALGYPSYDRGVVEMDTSAFPPGQLQGLQAGDPWVAAYPLYATNQAERVLLEWPQTLDLLSAVLADAVADYLDPSVRTPQRLARLGWRASNPWQPVSPNVIDRAGHGTRFALTFDGGASSAPTPAILDALREAGVHATMFMTADFVERNPELVTQMAKDGHEFGNHSATHPHMTEISSAAMVAELDRLELAVQTLTGKSTRPWFRPPYGAYDARVVQTAASQGYYTLCWTADSADWRNDVSADTVKQRILRYAAPGAILVEHLGSPQSAQILPETLRLLKERGFSFGTLSEVMGSVD